MALAAPAAAAAPSPPQISMGCWATLLAAAAAAAAGVAVPPDCLGLAPPDALLAAAAGLVAAPDLPEGSLAPAPDAAFLCAAPLPAPEAAPPDCLGLAAAADAFLGAGAAKGGLLPPLAFAAAWFCRQPVRAGQVVL
jgi:hypothetical protein